MIDNSENDCVAMGRRQSRDEIQCDVRPGLTGSGKGWSKPEDGELEDLDRAQVEQAAMYFCTSFFMEGQKKRLRGRLRVLWTPHGRRHVMFVPR